MRSAAWSDDDLALFARREERTLRRLLPGFGAAFGLSVLGAGIWSQLADGHQSAASLMLRLLLVLAASFAYRTPRAGQAASRRGALVYLLHAAALAANTESLAAGLRHAMPLLFAWMACAGLLETRPRRCVGMLAPTALLLAGLGAALLPLPAAIATVAGSALAVVLAVSLGTRRRRLRHASWRRERELLRACRYDSLSGALARGFATQLAQRELALARRHRRPLAVALLDIDHFKRVNDLHGHAAGDAVIQALVATCMQALRTSDYVGRLGGEEFVCVMPETDAGEALACAHRVREAFAEARIANAPDSLRCTVSIGIAVYRGRGDWDALLREADGALYAAKAAGRNRVVLAVPEGEEARV